MAALNIRVNYSFLSTAARRAGSLTVSSIVAILILAPATGAGPSSSDSWRGGMAAAATLYRRLKPPCDVPMNWPPIFVELQRQNEIYAIPRFISSKRSVRRINRRSPLPNTARVPLSRVIVTISALNCFFVYKMHHVVRCYDDKRKPLFMALLRYGVIHRMIIYSKCSTAIW